MRDRAARSDPPLILVAHAQEWFARSLESILRPAGYTVHKTYTGRDALARARRVRPDAVVLDAQLPDSDALVLSRALRMDLRLAPSMPILMTTAGPALRSLTLDALRAGANGVWGQPLDTEEFLLRLEGHLRAKFDADRARDHGLVDEDTGLYNARGLERRLEELAAHVDRQGAPLTCVVVAPADDSRTSRPALAPSAARGFEHRGGDGYDPQVESLGRMLRAAGRVSDAIGWASQRAFAVLAPETDAQGAVCLGERLAAAVRRLAGALGDAPPTLHAGYDTASGFRDGGLEPHDLLTRAFSALRSSELSEDGPWIQPYSLSVIRHPLSVHTDDGQRITDNG
ncbi:MAG TPA: response regulator [Gemmatimonadales bacterium]|nr:response regulator [Gemmatimonadales bacterium]